MELEAAKPYILQRACTIVHLQQPDATASRNSPQLGSCAPVHEPVGDIADTDQVIASDSQPECLDNYEVKYIITTHTKLQYSVAWKQHFLTTMWWSCHLLSATYALRCQRTRLLSDKVERSVKAARRGELGVMVYIMAYSDNSENKDTSGGK